MRGPKPRPLRERLYSRLAPCPDADCECLLWDRPDDNGYGKIWTGSHTDGTRRIVYIHRAVWELENDRPIPDGLTIDHVKERGCRHKHCGNIAHLEAVSGWVNTRRRQRNRPRPVPGSPQLAADLAAIKQQVEERKRVRTA